MLDAEQAGGVRADCHLFPASLPRSLSDGEET